MTVYRVAGGIGFILLALPMLGLGQVPPVVTGIVLVIAGVALLAGI